MLLLTGIPSQPVVLTVIGLTIIALAVLILPFIVKLIEHNLELFFLIMGVLSVTVSGLWSVDLVIEALKAPVMISGIPIGIFQVVLIFGLLIYFFNLQFERAVLKLAEKLSMRVFVFLLIFILGLISSMITVILAAVLLAEIAAILPLERKDKVKLVIITCYAVGLGAVLTPLGEPLSTILVQKLSGSPYYAGFFWPAQHFGIYVIEGALAAAIFGSFWIGKKTSATAHEEEKQTETIKGVILRAVKVFAFVAALVLLGEGFKPIIIWFFAKVNAGILYWINIISAVLDNATLTAIEISADLALSQIIAIIMGLLIAGGMLIPGNIPNIVAAGKLKISMKEWAKYGVPIGLVLMVVYFAVLIPVIY